MDRALVKIKAQNKINICVVRLHEGEDNESNMILVLSPNVGF